MPVIGEDLNSAFSDLNINRISRRRFLNLLSTSTALALGTSCSNIDRGTIVPYTKKTDAVIPGVAAYYASSFQECLDTHGVLVKTREGRPINIVGSAEHPISQGKTTLRAIGDLLGLYDPDRLRAPVFAGKPSTWREAVEAMSRALADAGRVEKPALLLTGAVVSPSQRALINDLKAALPSLRHAVWEPCTPHSAIFAAGELFGSTTIPRLRFDRADLVLSLQADFFGSDLQTPLHVRDFAARRPISKPSDQMNRLWVVEGTMTLTGANADQRLQVRPSMIAPLAFGLVRMLNEVHSIPLPKSIGAASLAAFEPGRLAEGLGIELSALRHLAADLAAAGKSSLVVAGSSLRPEAHIACYLLSAMLESEGNTIDTGFDLPAPELLTNSGLRTLLEDAAQGVYGAAIFWDANPAYGFPDADLWKNAIERIPESYRIGLYEDETALDCTWRLPEHHWLEAWGDFEAASDFISLRQPVIGAIHDTRQAEDILLASMREMNLEVPQNYLEYVRARWQAQIYPAGSPVDFGVFWNAALHDGGVRHASGERRTRVMNPEAIESALSAAGKIETAAGQDDIELVLSPGIGVFDGRYANNGWLNELPDPVTKTTWGNPLLLSISDAERLGLEDEDIVTISTAAGSVETSIIIQPGQCRGTAGLALGYGRRTGNVAVGVGANAYSLIDVSSPSPCLLSGVRIDRDAGGAGGMRRAAVRTQRHYTMEGRNLARSWTLEEFSQRTGSGAVENDAHLHASLIPDRTFPEHKWGMAIDLSACVGCSTCVIACQVENNIPVVGPEQIRVGREMHWLRVDRYYEGDPHDPSVVHQPMLCQHCDNAPCEIVCPVNATTHSPDGLNQMVYNRCVGTRYCSNNCPFKVRRFNFFDYTSMKREPESLAHNPEVTVRPRGVMEKCSFCIQRIQDVKQTARVESRRIRDGEIRPACAAACPAQAIVFGDLNDAESRVSVLGKTDRSYRMLEELGIKPSTTYLARISNPAIGKDEE